MLYLIPMSILAYKNRNNIGYYILKTYSYLEIQYNRWYKSIYIDPDYKFFINGQLIQNQEELTKNEFTKDTLFEIEYLKKPKRYRLAGKKRETMIDFLDNKDAIFNSDERNPRKIFRWISATDENNNKCYLEQVKKFAGPNGDFYINEYDMEVESVEWLKNKKLVLTDFRLDEYVLDGTQLNNRIQLVKNK
jgi:hypothetical protein